MPYMRATRPPLESSTPTVSTPGASGARDSGTSRMTATRAIATTGTFIRKIQPHQALERIQPPRIGPSGRATKLAALQMPMARGRSFSEKRTVTSDRAMTIRAAPASPTTTRAAMKRIGDGAIAQATDPSPKTTRATIATRRRPKRSPTNPAGSMPAARASV